MQYISEFINSEEEKFLINFINSQEFNTTLKRRTQQYGFEYNYANLYSPPLPAKPIPKEFEFLLARIYNLNFLKKDFNQIIVNEYLPGQGIGPHTDHVKFFGDTIISLSLGSGCEMIFKNKTDTKSIYLEPRSLIILQNEMRYNWTHEIPFRKTDNKIKRDTRLSITFRNAK